MSRGLQIYFFISSVAILFDYFFNDRKEIEEDKIVSNMVIDVSGGGNKADASLYSSLGKWTGSFKFDDIGHLATCKKMNIVASDEKKMLVELKCKNKSNLFIHLFK